MKKNCAFCEIYVKGNGIFKGKGKYWICAWELRLVF